jgi:hypothetical protein
VNPRGFVNELATGVVSNGSAGGVVALAALAPNTDVTAAPAINPRHQRMLLVIA